MLDVNEAYTTKTVSWTGEVLENLGGAAVMVGQDGERMDRDYNGARGIYLRAGRYPHSESMAFRVRRERGKTADQRKCESRRVSDCSRKLDDEQYSLMNFYRVTSCCT